MMSKIEPVDGEKAMSDHGIKPEWKEAWRWASLPPDNSLTTNLADLAAHLLATLMESEFRREHREAETTDSKPGKRFWMCLASCNYTDPRHNYDEDAWLGEARKYLSERRDDEIV